MSKKSDKKKESEDIYTSSEVKRHMSVLMEHVDDRIAGIGERFVDFDRKLDLNTEMLQMHEQWFGNIDQKLNSHTEMIGVLAEDMAIVKEKVKSIEANLKQKVDREEFVSLGRRVSSVEVKVC